MHQTLTFAVALLATSALAAPAAKKHQQHKQDASPLGNFKVAIPGRPDLRHNIDTAHEINRIKQKFAVAEVAPRHVDTAALMDSIAKKFDVVVPNVFNGGSTTISVPDVPDIIDTILGGGKQTKATSTSSSKHHITTSAKSTGVIPTVPVSSPSFTSILSVPAVTSESLPPQTYSEPASTTESAAPVTASSVSSEIAPEPTTSSSVVEHSTAAPESTVESSSAYSSPAPETSAPAPETTTAPAPEASTPAPETSAPPPATTTPAPETTAAPKTTAAPTTTPETTAAPATSAPETTFTPSFTFAPSTSEAWSSSTLATSSKKAAATVNASPEHNDSEYLSPVSIGGQTLTLDFDTGSADLWVFSSKLSADQIGGHTAFDPTKSSTWSDLNGASWKISYGDGSGASGSVGYDQVVIGGATATHQAVEVATSVAASFVKDTNNDGLVGLGFSNINTVQPTPQSTFFENIMGNLDQPLFTADLRADSAGSYEFGTINAAKYTGDLHYVNIDSSKGFWQFPSTSYQINGQTYQIPNAAPAVADTGTSIILADASAVQAYYAQVPNSVMNSTAGGYTYPCGTALPDYGISIGDFTAVIPGAQVTYAADGSACFGGIQPNTGINYQILGDTLFKQYFAVFNGGAKTFGIANKA